MYEIVRSPKGFALDGYKHYISSQITLVLLATYTRDISMHPHGDLHCARGKVQLMLYLICRRHGRSSEPTSPKNIGRESARVEQHNVFNYGTS
jgi:hypothetical protein